LLLSRSTAKGQTDRHIDCGNEGFDCLRRKAKNL